MPNAPSASSLSVLLLPLLLLLLAASGLHGFATGAPRDVKCTMKPNHGNYTPLTVDANVPYIIRTSKSTYFGRDHLNVTVKGKNNGTFAGLRLIAKDRYGGIVGFFSIILGDKTIRLLACNYIAAQTITHNKPLPKRSITVGWTSPIVDAGNITFIATMVTNFSTFYMGVRSPPISYLDPSLPLPPVTMNMDMNNSNHMSMNNSNHMNNGGQGTRAVSVSGCLVAVFAATALLRMVHN